MSGVFAFADQIDSSMLAAPKFGGFSSGFTKSSRYYFGENWHLDVLGVQRGAGNSYNGDNIDKAQQI